MGCCCCCTCLYCRCCLLFVVCCFLFLDHIHFTELLEKHPKIDPKTLRFFVAWPSKFLGISELPCSCVVPPFLSPSLAPVSGEASGSVASRLDLCGSTCTLDRPSGTFFSLRLSCFNALVSGSLLAFAGWPSSTSTISPAFSPDLALESGFELEVCPACCDQSKTPSLTKPSRMNKSLKRRRK